MPHNSLTSVFNHPSRWTRDAFARDKDGASVQTFHHEAVCWCLVGAMSVSGIYGSTGGLKEVLKAIRGRGALSWNDAPGRTFADVRELAEEVDRSLGLKIVPLLPTNP